MKILWRNFITMWLTQFAGYCFLLYAGYGTTSAAVISGLVSGFSFGVCGVDLVQQEEKTTKK